MKTLVSAAAVAAIAGSAFGLGETLDRSNYPILDSNTPGITINARDLGSHSPLGRALSTVYDSVSGGLGFLASAPISGSLGVEDYGTTLSASGPPNGTPTNQFDTIPLAEYVFVGGVNITGGIMFFDFFFNDFSFSSGFGVAFPQTGAFIWTITIGNPIANQVPTEGYHTLFANDDPGIGPVTGGQWFVSDVGANPLIGHNDNAWDNGSFDYGTVSAPNVVPIGYNFAIVTPAPGAAVLMGMAGFAGIRRRRR